MGIEIILLLGLLPFISWSLQYISSKKSGLLKSFKKNWTCYYVDWIFVAINLLFISSVQFSNAMFIFFGFSIIPNSFTHYLWGKHNEKNKFKDHLYFKNTSKLNLAGYAHLIFSMIEMTIMFAILFFIPISSFIYIELFLIIAFGSFVIIGSHKIHVKINRLDLMVGLIIIGAAILKIIILLL